MKDRDSLSGSTFLLFAALGVLLGLFIRWLRQRPAPQPYRGPVPPVIPARKKKPELPPFHWN